MPEGDTIFRAARTLNRALTGQIVTRFESVLPALSRVDEDAPLSGRVIESVTARGKWMLMRFSGGLTLLTHMLMNGSWHIYRAGERWQRPRSEMRISIETAQWQAVAFRVQVAEFHTDESLRRREALNALGPDLLAADFDEAEAIAQLRSRPELPIADALLSQSLLAGLGNVYKSEVCFLCGVDPFRLVSTLTSAELDCLVRTARKLMRANVADSSRGRITTGSLDPHQKLWVYGRRGEPCRKCATPIQSRKQGPSARVTFWCPNCQK